MNTNLKIGIIALAFFSMMTVAVMAWNKPTLVICGNMDNYEYAWVDWPLDDPDEGRIECAELLQASWNVKLVNDRVHFQAHAMEKNLYEEFEGSPEGSVDVFEMSLKTDDYIFEANVLSFTGNCKVTKQGYTFDGEIKTKTYITTYKITIDLEAESGGFFLDANPIDEGSETPWFGDWDRPGDVLGYYPS